MQDRNGNYADKVLDELFIGDESAPKIIANSFYFQGSSTTQAGAAPEGSVTSPTEFFYPINAGDPTDQYQGEKFFKFQMEFDEQMDKASLEAIANYEIAGTAKDKVKLVKAELLTGNTKAILTFEAVALPEETNYIEYNLIHDETLSIGFKAGAILDYSKSNALTEAAKTFKYKDLIKPKLRYQEVIRTNENFEDDGTGNRVIVNKHVLELTFTEAINSTTLADFDIKAVHKNISNDTTGTTPILNGNYTVAIDPTNNKKVMLTINQALADRDEVQIKLNSNSVKDVANNTISIANTDYFNALYIYRLMPMSIFAAKLQGTIGEGIVGSTTTYYSKDIEVGISADYAYPGMTIYYAVTNNPGTKLSPFEVMNANKTYATVFGKEPITDISQAIEFDATEDGGSSARFTSGQRIHLVIKDSYGNVSNVVSEVIVKQ